MRGTAAVGQNEDRFGGLGRRPSKLGPTGSVPASFMHVAGHTCSESRDMNTKYHLPFEDTLKTIRRHGVMSSTFCLLEQHTKNGLISLSHFSLLLFYIFLLICSSLMLYFFVIVVSVALSFILWVFLLWILSIMNSYPHSHPVLVSVLL